VKGRGGGKRHRVISCGKVPYSMWGGENTLSSIRKRKKKHWKLSYFRIKPERKAQVIPLGVKGGEKKNSKNIMGP